MDRTATAAARYRYGAKHWWNGWIPFTKPDPCSDPHHGLVRDYRANWITHERAPNGLVQIVTKSGWTYQSKLRFLRKARLLDYYDEVTTLLLRGTQAQESLEHLNERKEKWGW